MGIFQTRKERSCGPALLSVIFCDILYYSGMVSRRDSQPGDPALLFVFAPGSLFSVSDSPHLSHKMRFHQSLFETTSDDSFPSIELSYN
jgi:hypothetical protein